MRVNKTSLARMVARLSGLANDQSRKVIDVMAASIIRSLASGDEVKISDFGKFYLQTRKSRFGRNPRTGEKIEIQSRRAVGFKCFQRMRNRLNGMWAVAAMHAVKAERRAGTIRQTLPQGRAVVRISGIPVCEFTVRDISGNGTGFLIERDSAVLRNLQIGQQIEIHMVFSGHSQQPSLQRSKIAHITYPEPDSPYNGYVLVGLQVIDRL